MFADAATQHMTDNVRRLCWSRGYVIIIHGGGATPVAQTPDTDLNQHIRRMYVAKEAELLIHLMRVVPGCVPSPKPEQCIDMMVEVLQSTDLHLQAARGYKSTGANVALDGTEDHLIVREAATFWHNPEDPMPRRREKALTDVRVEYEAGRLQWTYEGVFSLIQPYPKRGHMDVVREGQDDDVSGDESDVCLALDELTSTGPIGESEHEVEEETRGSGMDNVVELEAYQ